MYILFHLTPVDDVELLDPGGEEEAGDEEEPGGQGEVQQEGQQREHQRARDGADGAACLADHLSSDRDPLENRC